MTPTPEMDREADLIADGLVQNRSSVRWRVAKRAALAGILKASEKAALICDAYSRGPASQKPHGLNCASLIRNGEHLK